MRDLDQQDDDDDLDTGPEHGGHDYEGDGIMDIGRGDAGSVDLDNCAACGQPMPELHTGMGGGGMFCPDCDDLTDVSDLDV